MVIGIFSFWLPGFSRNGAMRSGCGLGCGIAGVASGWGGLEPARNMFRVE